MHQTLYRKYRPRTFNEVVGQKVIIKILKNIINQNKLGHAYLFSGSRGTGKTSVAKILGQTINCENLKDCVPCQKCSSCLQIKDNKNVDIIEIDAASNNGIEEIRELKSKVSLVPSISKYKVYIIDEVHMLSIGAFNALLKTLEEPPKHVIFILATTEAHKIPETILSRCQRLDFKNIDDKSMFNRLKEISKLEKIKIEDDVLEEIVRFSNGGLRDAINLLEQVSIYVDGKIKLEDFHEINGTLPQEQLKELVDKIFQKDLIGIFELMNKYDEVGKNLLKLLEEIMNFLKNLLIYKKIGENGENNISQEIFSSFFEKIETQEIISIITKINEGITKMKNYNNPKLVFELVIISLIDVKKTFGCKDKVNIKNNNCQTLKQLTVLDNETNSQNNVKHVEIYKTFKEVRINNTFVGANRTSLNNIKERVKTAKKYILDAKYKNIVSLILDGQIKAVSESNIIFVYPTEGMEKMFNNKILLIEQFLFKLFNKNYKVVALNENEWYEYRKEFISKVKIYDYIEETEEINMFLNKSNLEKTEKDEIHQLFGDIIEYKEKEE